ncbi:hypothetical protein K438DRAFT_1017621 [Mycena galopus ATCC 62051]|nr:hypothetical protein K438DRAFT_1017621 [Mycena galopus ATCC 62051]
MSWPFQHRSRRGMNSRARGECIIPSLVRSTSRSTQNGQVDRHLLTRALSHSADSRTQRAAGWFEVHLRRQLHRVAAHRRASDNGRGRRAPRCRRYHLDRARRYEAGSQTQPLPSAWRTRTAHDGLSKLAGAQGGVPRHRGGTCRCSIGECAVPQTTPFVGNVHLKQPFASAWAQFDIVLGAVSLRWKIISRQPGQIRCYMVVLGLPAVAQRSAEFQSAEARKLYKRGDLYKGHLPGVAEPSRTSVNDDSDCELCRDPSSRPDAIGKPDGPLTTRRLHIPGEFVLRRSTAVVLSSRSSGAGRPRDRRVGPIFRALHERRV